jgi:hypothetical protein
MAVGEITRDGFPYLIVKGLTKTGVTVTKGQVVIFDTDGWNVCGDAGVGPHGVAMNAATGAGQVELRVMLRGCVIIAKANEIQLQGQSVKWNATAAALLTQDKDTLMSIVGTVMVDAVKAATETEVLLLQ